MNRSRILILRFFALWSAGHIWCLVGPSEEPRDAYTIAFASFAPIRTNIFIANSDGDNPRPLLGKPDVDFNPSFSRDGVWIVFTSQRSGSADIYRVHPDGSGLERLTDAPAFDDQGVLSS